MTTKTRRKPKPTVKKLTEKELLQDLRDTLSLAFSLIDTEDMKEISNLTGLHLSTIYKLKNGEYTLRIQVRTKLRVLGAAGLKAVTTEYGTQVRLV
jgi:hypothetical protein